MAKFEKGTFTSVATTELNSLANGSGALGAAFDNGATGNLFFWGDFQLDVIFGVAPAVDQAIELFLIPAEDGTNYATNNTGATPRNAFTLYVGSFDTFNLTTQKLVLRGVPLPPVLFKALLVNKSGQAFPASGSTLKLLPSRTQ